MNFFGIARRRKACNFSEKLSRHTKSLLLIRYAEPFCIIGNYDSLMLKTKEQPTPLKSCVARFTHRHLNQPGPRYLGICNKWGDCWLEKYGITLFIIEVSEILRQLLKLVLKSMADGKWQPVSVKWHKTQVFQLEINLLDYRSEIDSASDKRLSTPFWVDLPCHHS